MIPQETGRRLTAANQRTVISENRVSIIVLEPYGHTGSTKLTLTTNISASGGTIPLQASDEDSSVATTLARTCGMV